MLEFVCALAAFIVSHRLPTIPAVRGWLVARLGERVYLILYGLLSLAIVAWLISAAVRAPTFVIWPFQAWQAVVPLVVMPVAFILLIASALSPNPLSVSMRPAPADTALPAVVSITRHPILWAFGLWARLAPDRQWRSRRRNPVWRAWVFRVYAGMRILDRRKQRHLGADEWDRLAGPTSVLPFGAILAGRARFRSGS